MIFPKDWHSDTKQVRAGLARTENRETSEALFLNSGFVYDSAEQATVAFKGEAANLIYSRYGNPTLQMVDEKLADIEGAKACCVCATGMATVFASMACQLEVGGRKVAFAVLNSLKLIDIFNNLGDAKTLACHPTSTTHANLSDRERAALSLSESHIRLSVGLEHKNDLWSDLCQALDKISPAKIAGD